MHARCARHPISAPRLLPFAPRRALKRIVEQPPGHRGISRRPASYLSLFRSQFRILALLTAHENLQARHSGREGHERCPPFDPTGLTHPLA